jgi:tetratricopeptide (TPR) repeat protein
MNVQCRASLAVLAALVLSPLGAHAHAEVGTPVDNLEMRTLAGGKEKLLAARAKANVVIFFRPNQERSVDALRQMGRCEKDFTGKPVRWVGVVSSTEAAEDVKATVRDAGIGFPVLVDENDALYDKLGVRLHPMVVVVDAKAKVAAFEMYRQIDYCDIIKGRIRLVLGEIDTAQMDKILNPEKSGLPGDDLPKKAMRDVNLGRKLLDLDLADKAIEKAKRALEIAPVPAAWTLMGDAFAKKGDCGEAARAYDEARKLDPKDAKAAAGPTGCK